MRVAFVSITILALVAACNGGSGGGADGNGDATLTGDPSTLTCEQIRDALRQRTQAVSAQCSTVADCTVVGNAQRSDGFPTCDCAPTFSIGPGGCSGSGVNAAAWQADARAQELLDEWETRCVVPGACGMSQICGCDCGRGELTCSPNGFCTVGMYNCFPTPTVDAAVDAPPDASFP